MQQRACDQLAEALVLITEASRLDGSAKFDSNDLGVIAGKLAQASPAFRLDEIVARALERRAKLLGLPSSAAELLTLLDPSTVTVFPGLSVVSGAGIGPSWHARRRFATPRYAAAHASLLPRSEPTSLRVAGATD
jgi:hypothetical protein